MIVVPFGLQKKFEKSYKFDIVNDDRFKDANIIFRANALFEKNEEGRCL